MPFCIRRIAKRRILRERGEEPGGSETPLGNPGLPRLAIQPGLPELAIQERETQPQGTRDHRDWKRRTGKPGQTWGEPTQSEDPFSCFCDDNGKRAAPS